MNFMAEIPLSCIYNQIWYVSMNQYTSKFITPKLIRRKTESFV